MYLYNNLKQVKYFIVGCNISIVKADVLMYLKIISNLVVAGIRP